MSMIPHWPCECVNWARAIDPTKPMTNHHPSCPHVDDSLIDVWKVSDGNSHFYAATEVEAAIEADGCDDITITKVKMHREVFANLPEFAGF